MPKDWKEITDEEILNFDGAQTGQMARYERIMQQRTIVALNDVRGQLNGLMGTIYKFHQGVKGTINSSTQELKRSAEELSDLYDKVSKDQSRQQKALVVLTVVLALATVTYTAITWQSVSAMREANEIQRQALELERARLEKEGGT